jgi:hypothetical protein
MNAERADALTPIAPDILITVALRSTAQPQCNRNSVTLRLIDDRTWTVAALNFWLWRRWEGTGGGLSPKSPEMVDLQGVTILRLATMQLRLKEDLTLDFSKDR